MKRSTIIAILLLSNGLMVPVPGMAGTVVGPTTLIHNSVGVKVINVQGKLTDSAGKLLSGPVTVTFRLYTNVNDGLANAAWVESQSVSVSNGLFNVGLGRVMSLDPLPFNKAYYLGIQVAGDASELSPRQLLGSAAYANGSLTNFDVAQNLIVSSNVSVGGALTVNSNVTAKANVAAAGNVTVGGDLSTRGKDVGGYLVPAGAILMFAGNCPSGWTRFSDLDNMFPVGSATYGATGGTVSHSHTISNDGGQNTGDAYHTTSVVTGGWTDPAGMGVGGNVNLEWVADGMTHRYGRHVHTGPVHNHGGETGTKNNLPPYRAMVFCQKQ